jgi:phospholipid/cholesterol/gamma-HCH transport system permease protein
MVKADWQISKRISRLLNPSTVRDREVRDGRVHDRTLRNRTGRDRKQLSLEKRETLKESPCDGKVLRVNRARHGCIAEVDNPIYHSAMAILLAGQVMHRLVRGRCGHRQIMEHLMCAGPRALGPVVLTNVCGGIIFAIQSAREMARYGSISALGGVFAAAYCRELAPLLTAGVLACQVGSAFAAEIASMKLSQQIDALKMLRTDPIDYLVMPRVIACAIMLPILSTLALFCGVAGGALIATQAYALSLDIFLDGVRTYLTVSDVLFVMLKALLFGGVIAVASCSRGLTATLHGRGVGQSATSAVVTAWIAIFLMDLLLASLALFQSLH